MLEFRTAQIEVNGSSLGNALTDLLMAPDILPGDQPSYETCKTLWLYHPLGKKMVESPIEMAQCQEREISIPDSPEDRVRDQFVREWKAIDADNRILNVMSHARAYGIASIALLTEEVAPNLPVDFRKLSEQTIGFNVLDPLNTAGSLVLNQDPNSIDFQKVTTIAVSGVAYHRSRTVTMMHERPVYIAYTTSAFGFVGRSVFQRALFPLKSFIQSLVTDDLVTKKAGVFIAMLKTAGAIIDNIMQRVAGLKRLFVKAATNGNVISIGHDEKIETLNMQNIDGAYGMARKNILENIAVSADMPAEFLNSETFAEGFGEGSEDAKRVARYVDRVRRQMDPLYSYFDKIVQHRAWNRDFYKIIQKDYPEWSGVPYEEAFYRWSISFSAAWPSLLTEPDSEKVKTDDVKLKAIMSTITTFGPMLDPENKATLLMWAEDNINENKMMFQSPLTLDYDALAEYVPPQPAGDEDGEGGTPGIDKEPNPPGPMSIGDAQMFLQRLDGIVEEVRSARANSRSMARLDEADLRELVAIMEKRPQGLPQPIHVHLDGKTLAIAPPAPPPKRDRAGYMREYRARRNGGGAAADGEDDDGGPYADEGKFEESKHPRGKGGEKGGQFVSKGGEGSASGDPAREGRVGEESKGGIPAEQGEIAARNEGKEAGAEEGAEQPVFQTKREHAAHLLKRGTTAAELMKTLGWPSISVPATAKSVGLKLEKTKEGGITKYKGIPMRPEEREAAGLMPEGVKRSGGPASRDPSTWSLFEFIASKGGVDVSDAQISDVRSMLGTKNKFVPGFGSLIRPKGGIKLDRLREAAVEAGYIEDIGFNTKAQATSTVQTLLDAMDDEARGKRVYQRGQKPEHVEGAEQDKVREENLRHLDEKLDETMREADIGLDDAQRKRVLEIMDKEGISDPLEAIEREAMEWVNDASERGEGERILDEIPGWDVPDDAGAAPKAGGASTPF